MEPFLCTRELTKSFPQIIANRSISFDVLEGEIHFLLGENGAGKTTLVNCLYGSYSPDSGRILYRGQEVHLHTPNDALRLGIGLVHQHFVLIPRLTVTENIVVGAQSPGVMLNFHRDEAKIGQLCEELALDLDLHAKVQELSIGEQQWVEILKALYLGVDLLMLDEPTAVQTPQETRNLFATLRRMKCKGMTFVIVTHKLREAMELADRISVLRGGNLIATVNAKDVTEGELARLMVGREVMLRVTKERKPLDRPVLEIRDLKALDDKRKEALNNATLSIRAGEILGIAGVSGNGQRELFETLIGVRKAHNGMVLVDGKDITKLSPKQIASHGVSSIPEDRIKEGLVMAFSVEENLILGYQSSRAYCRGPFLDGRRVRESARRSIEMFNIASPLPNQPTQTLSGGNLQKVILAREMRQRPRCLIANQPTRGLDVGSTEFVRKQLLELAETGVAIMLISDDLEEIFDLSDRVAIIFKGQILAIVDAEEAELESVGLLMAGVVGGDRK